MAEQPAYASDTLLPVTGMADKRPKGPERRDRYIDRAQRKRLLAGVGPDALIRALAEVAAEPHQTAFTKLVCELERLLPREVQSPSLTECGKRIEQAIRDCRRGLGEPAEVPPDTRLNPAEPAQSFRISESLLTKKRRHGTGPPKPVKRAIRDFRQGLGEPAEAPAPDTLLNTCEAAQCLGVSESFLAKARMQSTGPPYRKLGRSVRYAPGDLNQYLLACSRTSTADQQALPKPVARQRTALPQARKNIPPPKRGRAPA